MGAKILIIDHNDSFTYNLVGLFETFAVAAGNTRQVDRVDIWPVDDLESIDYNEVWQFDALVLSPGPGLPKDYPAVLQLLRVCLEGARKMPVLGICLGLQTIVSYFGGALYNLALIQHGRQVNIDMGYSSSDNSPVSFANCSALFAGLELPIKVGLYHSWVMDNSVAVKDLEILATAVIPESSLDGISMPVVMAIRHKQLPVYGLQFHPESYMTPVGDKIIRNWLEML